MIYEPRRTWSVSPQTFGDRCGRQKRNRSVKKSTGKTYEVLISKMNPMGVVLPQQEGWLYMNIPPCHLSNNQARSSQVVHVKLIKAECNNLVCTPCHENGVPRGKWRTLQTPRPQFEFTYHPGMPSKNAGFQFCGRLVFLQVNVWF